MSDATLTVTQSLDTLSITTIAGSSLVGGGTITGPLNIGVDDAGYDVKFFGDTASRYMLWDSSDDSLELSDNAKIKLGTDGDLQLYHDGSQSRISDTGTGRLTIETDGDSIRLTKGTSENMAIFTPDGSVDLYYNNVKKFETTSLGATVTGKLVVNGSLDVSGTTTTFSTSSVSVANPVFTLGGVSAPSSDDNKDRGIEFHYYDSSAKKGFFGYDDSTSSFVFLTAATNNSKVFTGTAGNLVVGNITASATTLTGNLSAVNIAGTLTTAAQTNVTSLGTLTALTVDDITINGSNITDSGTIYIEAGGDIHLDAGGGDVLLTNDGTDFANFGNATGAFHIDAKISDDDIKFRGNDGGSTITALTLDMSAAGAATFNDKVIATELDISGDVDIDGTLEADAITVNGTALAEHIADTVGAMVGSNTETGITVTYDDSDNTLDFVLAATVTNNIAAKLPLAGGTLTGNTIFNDGIKAIFGTGNDLGIYHDGSHSWIEDTGQGDLYIKGSDDVYIMAGSDIAINCNDNAEVSLWHNNSKKFETTTDGISVTGTIQSSDGSASAPSVSFSSDTDTGLYRATANNIAITAGGSEVIRFDDNLKTTTKGSLRVNGSTTEGIIIASSSSASQGLKIFNNSSTDDASIFNHYNGNLIFGTGNTEVARFDSSGRLGIGTTSPSQTLTVTGTARITGHTDIANTIDVSGKTRIYDKLGVGGGNWVDPQASVDIYAAPNTNTLFLRDSSDSEYTHNFYVDASGNGHTTMYAEGNAAKIAFSTSGDSYFNGGNLVIGATAAQSKFHVSGGDIRVDNNQGYLAETAGGGVITAAKMDGSDNLLIGDGNFVIDVTGSSELMRLDSTGLGIGGTPDSLCHIKSTVSAGTDNYALRIQNPTSVTDARIGIAFAVNSNTGNSWKGAAIQASNNGSSGEGHLTFGSVLNNSFTERVRITDTGNVGIATTAPSCSLEVSGDKILLSSSSNDRFIECSTTGAGAWFTANSTNQHYQGYKVGNNWFMGQYASNDFVIKDGQQGSGVPVFIITDTTGDFTQNYINYTDGSNYEALKISAESDHIKFNTSSIGSFASNNRSIKFHIGDTERLELDNSGAKVNGALRADVLNTKANDANIIFRDTGMTRVGNSYNNPTVIKDAGAVGIGTASPTANADLTLGGGELCMAETTTPTADTNFGKVYCKADNKLYFQDGAGTEHEIAFA